MPKRLFFVSLLLSLLFSANFAFALEITYPPIPGVMTPQEFLEKIKKGEIPFEKALPLYAQYLFHLTLMGGGFIALGAVVFGGVKYLISGGNVEKMKDARDQISSGILGLVIIFSSYILITTINPQLAIFKIERPGGVVVPPSELVRPPEPTEPVYVEVPSGRLIQRVEIRAEIAKKRAQDVWYIGAEDTDKDHTSLKELAECLNELTKLCDCGIVPTEDCYKEDSTCSTGDCLKDPCNKAIDRGLCEIIDDSLANLCPGVSGMCNLRDVIDEKTAQLKQMTLELERKKGYLPAAREALRNESFRLELSEALLENAISWGLMNPVINYDAYLCIDEKQREDKILWAWKDITDLPEDPSGLPVPPPECIGAEYQPWEATPIAPSCTLCSNPDCPNCLYCYGNEYRVCDTEQKIKDLCSDAPDDDGLPPRDCPGHHWFSPGEFPLGTVLYNGVVFPVPSGGVVVLESNAYPSWACGGKTLSEPKPDAATFYVPEERNEELIGKVALLLGEGLPPYPYPPDIGPLDCPLGIGPCSPENLSIFGAQAENASRVCQKESGANPWALNKQCLFGRFCDYSVGLFQINLLGRCPDGIEYNCKEGEIWCQIINEQELERCKEEYGLGDPDTNIQKAYEIFQDSGWCPWTAGRLCGLCGTPLVGFLSVTCTESGPSSNPDLNPELKGFHEVSESRDLFSVGEPIDRKAPKLQTILGRRPGISSVYALDTPSSHEAQWPVHLIGFQTNPGEPIRVPVSGRGLSGGYEIVVIYAEEDVLTIKYTEHDNVVIGYTIQFQNIETDPQLLERYKATEECQNGIRVLPAYREGEIIGKAAGDVLIVAVRDTGAWMDPRWEDHWWQE